MQSFGLQFLQLLVLCDCFGHFLPCLGIALGIHMPEPACLCVCNAQSTLTGFPLVTSIDFLFSAKRLE